MKKINQILGAAAIAAIVTLSAGTAMASPKGDEQRPAVVTSSSTELNTVRGQTTLGKGTPQRVAIVGTPRSDSDTLQMIRDCNLSPKMKDGSAACTKCCLTTAMK